MQTELTPLQKAQAELAELESDLPPLRQCSLQISLIIRRFLQGELRDPSLFETHEEFSRRVDSLSAVPEQCQRATRNLLEKLAELKYDDTSDDSSDSSRELLREAKDLLQNINDAQQKRKEEEDSLRAKLHSLGCRGGGG